MKKDITQEDWFKELKIKGMTDNSNHYVEMVEISKDQKEYWHGSDGAITDKGLKRDGLFNFAFSIIRFWRLNKFLIKLTIISLIIMFIIYVIKQIYNS